VPCVTEAQWWAFATRELPPEQQAAVERHLLECAGCRDRFGPPDPTLAPQGAKDDPPEVIARGSSIGRYLTLEPLGEGAMGVVYAAFDPELDRRVAIKLLRTHLSRDETAPDWRARMVREAQAMARISHPNVMPVYDVGTRGERVFVAMELVEGVTLKEWLRQKPRSFRERLEVCVAAGRGLAAAHAVGLIHRDFKPDNILVGADGRPRVTDFGLARARTASEPPPKALNPSAVFDSPLTRVGAVMGTPGYMSPEQATGQAVDERSDQFSFCATLYFALYGELPFAGDTLEEMVEARRQGRVRPAPSRTDVPAWVRQVMLRGLAGDPAERWPQMEPLLAALEHDPAQRRRVWIVAAAALVLVGGGGFVVHLRNARLSAQCRADARLDGVWDAARKQKIEQSFHKTGKVYAAQSFAEVERALDAYASGFAAMSADACAATRLRGEQPEAVLTLRESCLDGRLQHLRALSDVLAAADGDTVEHAVEAARALPPLAACADVATLSATTRVPSDPAARAQLDEVRRAIAQARALHTSGKYTAGLAALEPAIAGAHRLGLGALEAEALELSGRLRHRASDYKGAEQAYKEALWAAEASHVDALKLAAALGLAVVAVDNHGYDAAHDWLRYAEAAGSHAAASGAPRVDLLTTSAMVWFRESHYPESERAAREAIRVAEHDLPPDDLMLANACRALGDTLKYEGHWKEALAQFERARAIDEKVLGAEHPEVGVILRKEADAWSMQHDGQHALALSQQALAIFQRSLPPENLLIAQTRTNLAEALSLLGRHEEALAEERQALPAYERIFGPESEDVGVSCTNIGYALLQLHQYAEARSHLDRAIRIYEKTLAPGDPDIAEPLLRLGEVELAEGNPRKAQAPLERALALRANDGDPSELRADVEFALARAKGDRALAEKARADFTGGGKKAEAARVDAWLASRH
jgi:tetratricopeptide (TPR) repeat protein